MNNTRVNQVISAMVFAACTASVALADTLQVPAEYPTIQAAIDAASDGCEIIVAPGTYVENINFLGKAITVKSSDGPDVTTIDRGEEVSNCCFANGNPGCDDPQCEALICKADPVCCEGWDDICANEAMESCSVCSGSVVTCASGEGPGTVLEGFKITGGTGTDVGFGNLLGGGMYNLNSSPTVTDCIFDGNSATDGGGMFISGSSPTVSNCTFTGNTAGGGGGLANALNSSPTVSNCTFDGNSAPSGGGMHNSNNSNPTISDCTFSGNTATGGGGGGMRNSSSSPTITNCTFESNFAQVRGGGMDNQNGSNPTITNCAFTANSTGQFGGGGMVNASSNPTVEDCTFTGNSASFGGGMENFESSPWIANCQFIDNITTFEGGGVCNSTNSMSTIINCMFSGNTSGAGGGGVDTAINAFTTITNCTFSGNTAPEGGGIFTTDTYGGHSETVVNNTITWGNTPDQISDAAGATTTVNYSDVQGGWLGGAGNIDEDPLFVAPGIGDYHLSSGSPCIDAADNTALPPELDGNPRFVDDPFTPDCQQAPGQCGDCPVVDMGAYEYQTGCIDCCLGDFDCDGAVGAFDLALLLGSWGPYEPCPPFDAADFNEDCGVNAADLAQLLGNWGPCM